MKHLFAFLCLMWLGLALNVGVTPAYAQASDLEIGTLLLDSAIDLPTIVSRAHEGEYTALEPLLITLKTAPPAKPKPYKRLLASTQTKTVVGVPVGDHEALFQKYGSQFNVPAETLKKIAYCESHYNPGVVSRSGTYGGMYQYSASTWQSTRNAMGLDPNPDLRFDAEQAIMTSAFKIAAGGIGAWPVCGQR